MAVIRIEHTPAHGTLVHGTKRGDGAGEILRSVHTHFRWNRNEAAWLLLHSRDRRAKTYVIEQAKQALEKAGFTVEVSIDDAVRRDVADIEAERADRAEARASRHDELAAKAHDRWTRRDDSNRQTRNAIPLGQPLNNAPFVKRLHKSDEIVRRDQDKQQHHEQRATAARTTKLQRENPRVTTRRLERLHVERRRLERARAHHDPQSYTTRLAELTEKIDYWTAYLSEQEASSAWQPWKPEHFRPGDLVACRGQWRTVLRVNRKSLTVDVSLYGRKVSWTDRLPYDKVTGRHRDGQTLSTPPVAERSRETTKETSSSSGRSKPSMEVQALVSPQPTPSMNRADNVGPELS